VNRGDVWDIEGLPGGRRPYVIITRDRVIPYLRSVTVAEITTTVRGLPTEVPLGATAGVMEGSVVNCDNVFTISKHHLSARRGELDIGQTQALGAALAIAFGLDD
jgi:mRNA interferase MazF